MGSKISQNGFTFTYVYTYNGQKPIIEEWGIERLAGYMFLVETHRTRSQKYTKDRTYMNRFGNQVYTFDEMEFDEATNHDLNKLIKKISKTMSDDTLQELWLTPDWNTALDKMESFVKALISDSEKPVEVMGSVYQPEKFLSRPTEEEYATLKPVEEPKPVKKTITRPTTSTTNRTEMIGRRFMFNFIVYGVKECKIVDVQGKSYICEAYDDNGKILESGAKIGFTSKRIVKWM